MTEPPAAAPTLSVITVTWNHAEEIGEFLDELRAAGDECGFPIEAIIVDNASADGTAELVRTRHPWAVLIESGGNLGFAAGCNLGLEAARGDFLLLLNPDARARGNALRAMVAHLQQNRDVGAVGCMLLHGDGMPQQSAFAAEGAWSYWRYHSMLYPLREKARKLLWKWGLLNVSRPRNVGWLQGSCLMVPRGVFELVGRLDPSYFVYCEDADWCTRIARGGLRIVHLPMVAMPHRQMGSVARRPEYTFRRVYRSLVHFGNLHLEPAARNRLRRAMLADMYLRLPAYRLKALLGGTDRAAASARIASVKQLIAVIRAGNPDLFEDPPPR